VGHIGPGREKRVGWPSNTKERSEIKLRNRDVGTTKEVSWEIVAHMALTDKKTANGRLIRRTDGKYLEQLLESRFIEVQGLRLCSEFSNANSLNAGSGRRRTPVSQFCADLKFLQN
jgi:hypothetical protein